MGCEPGEPLPERKRVKKEADYYSSDSNNNSDSGPPAFYSLEQLPGPLHH